MRLLLPFAALLSLSAQAQEDIGVIFELQVQEPPITSGLTGIDIQYEVDPFGSEGAPKGEAPFCLYVPVSGLEMLVSGLHDEGGRFHVRTSDMSDPPIAYTVYMDDLITGGGVLGELFPSQPLIIDRPGLSDKGECNEGDNVSLGIGFPDDIASSFSTVLEEELSPGQVYEYNDVLTISFSAAF